MYKASVVRLKNVREHPNADRVKLATVFGNQIVIRLNSNEGDLGIYFPSDGQLSDEFCRNNNLYRKAELNIDSNQTGMFDENRRVRAQRFRGEISDGFWIPLSTVVISGIDSLNEGDEFDTLDGVPICNKYVNQATVKLAKENLKKSTRKAKTSIMFKEHFDTAHFGKYLHEFNSGDTIIITEKLHGTSGRVGHVLVDRELSFKDKIAKRLGIPVKESEWKYFHGSRRVVLDESKKETSFHDPTIREKAFKIFEGNLRKGETVFFEIVGYEPSGASIMPSVSTKKLGDSEFTKRYGETMNYSYGCPAKECDVYVYRMTFTDVDGHSVDYSWNDVVKRCNEIGVKTTPHIRTLTLDELMAKYSPGEFENSVEAARNELESMVTEMGTGPSIIDPSHIREGVCVRIESGLDNRTFKFKSFEFKLLEGIVKDSGVIDMEESQG